MVFFKPFILFPLYLWPGPNAWQPLYDQIDKYPNVNFNIIINPNSGPGTSGTPPDQTWIDTIAKLNSKPNTQLLGYTHVLYGARPSTEVQSDIATYASWAKYKAANIALDGIFFDESPSNNTPALLSYMKDLTTTARTSLKSTNKRIVLNPGVAVPREYYPLADTIVGFENYAREFDSALTSFPTNALQGPKQKTAFIIQGFSGTAAQQKQMINAMTANNITGIYISTTSAYDKFSRFWPQLVAQVNGVTAK
ncbi:hypothetical protein KVT40_007241 [Elsinoe batatas]|uniref:Spherulation-specific family 4 n=1 Tax=Elsinoe batatas TaxID=2601811 RepID=A0A8K0KYA5_9PEZI|nr:hypothetical protein KVT40_007241 [Elsinoe batatas]